MKKAKKAHTSKLDVDVMAQYEEMAKKSGTTVSSVIDQTLREVVSLALTNSEHARDYIKTVNNYFLQNFNGAPSVNLILNLAFCNFMAQNLAEVEVFKDLVIQEPHFLFKNNGELLTGDALIENLKAKYKLKFLKVKEMIEKEAAAMDKESATLASILN